MFEWIEFWADFIPYLAAFFFVIAGAELAFGWLMEAGDQGGGGSDNE